MCAIIVSMVPLNRLPRYCIYTHAIAYNNSFCSGRHSIQSHFRALDYTASRTRSSHGERCELLSIVGKKRSVILLSILPVHKVVSCRARPLEESNWMVHVSERTARLPKGHNILECVLNEPGEGLSLKTNLKVAYYTVCTYWFS